MPCQHPCSGFETITAWIESVENSEASVMWIKGSAGEGKSAIARTMAETLVVRKRLLGSYFFSRTDLSRNHAGSVVSTIAYQAHRYFPELRPNITGAIEVDPLILSATLEDQLLRLLAEPIQNMTASGQLGDSSDPLVIIIDGLDECRDPRGQIIILDMIHDAVRKTKLPLLWVVASRPEYETSHSLGTDKWKGLLTVLSLDAFFPDHDIQFFLEDSFEEIRTSHPMRSYLPPKWPELSAIHTLVQKSSGQFIFASTVIKFLSSIRHRPNHRLDIILQLRPMQNENPFSELDALYTQILESVKEEYIEIALTIISHIICTLYPWNIPDTEQLLHLQPGDIEIALADLASLVEIKSDLSSIRLRHASFTDFLCEKIRSKKFYIDLGERHAFFASQFLLHFIQPQSNPEWNSAQFEILWRMTHSHCRKASSTLYFKHAILTISFNILFNILQNFVARELPFGVFMWSMLYSLGNYANLQNHITQTLDEMLTRHMDTFSLDPRFLSVLCIFSAHNSTNPIFHSDKSGFFTLLMSMYDVPDKSGFTWRNSADLEFIRLVSYFAQDPMRSGKHALHTKKYSAVALRALQSLDDPSQFISPTFLHSPELLRVVLKFLLNCLPDLVRRCGKSEALVCFVNRRRIEAMGNIVAFGLEEDARNAQQALDECLLLPASPVIRRIARLEDWEIRIAIEQKD